MSDLLSAALTIIDWRFAVGLVLGCVLTLWYVVIGIYHPIIREQMEQNKALSDENSNKPD